MCSCVCMVSVGVCICIWLLLNIVYLKYGHRQVIYHYSLLLNKHTCLKHSHYICSYEVDLFQQYLIAHPVHWLKHIYQCNMPKYRERMKEAIRKRQRKEPNWVRRYATTKKFHISWGVNDHHGNSGLYDVCFGGWGVEV